MKKTIFCFWLFTFSSAILSAQIPTYFNLRERLTENGNPDDPPIRDARLALKVSIFENGTLVFEESHPDVKTNYDGYISIKVGDYNPSGLGNLDWQNTAKTIKIESRLFGSSGTYKRTYEDKLPVAAFAQLGRPSHFIKPSGVIEVFSDGGHPNIELRGKTAAQFPYLDFSMNGSDFHTRMGIEESGIAAIRTNGTGFEIDAGSGLDYTQKGSIGFHAKDYRFNNSNIKTNGFLVFDPGNSTQIGIENNSLFAIRTNGIGIELDAGVGRNYSDKAIINFHAREYVFNGTEGNSGVLRIKGSMPTPLNNYTFLSSQPKASSHKHYWGANPTTEVELPVGFYSSTNGNDVNACIIADGRVLAQEFNAYSDSRIKIPSKICSPDKACKTIRQLTVWEYKYIDEIKYGKQVQLGFLAQSLEKTYPEAVRKTSNIIPNIYRFAQPVYDSISNDILLELDSVYAIHKGERIQLFGREKDYILEVADVNGNTIVIKDWPEKDTKEVFVYGKEVDDFRVVDYNRIFTLNVSATQALIQEVEDLKKQVAALEKQNQMLQSENADLKTAFQAINSRIDALSKAVGSSVTTQVPAVSGTH